MKLQTLAELNAERAARRPVIVVTDIASGEQRLVKAKDFAADPLRAELDKALRMGKSAMVEVSGNKVFLNVYAPTAKLVIVGAVHISQALAPMAQSLGYDVTIVDLGIVRDRDESGVVIDIERRQRDLRPLGDHLHIRKALDGRKSSTRVDDRHLIAEQLSDRRQSL